MTQSLLLNIAIAEDQLLLRKAMVELLEQEEDFQVVFEASNGADLVNYMSGGKADLVISDLEMPQMGGMEVLANLRETQPEVPILILSANEEEESILQALQLGARGYLLKSSHPDEVMKAIRSVWKKGFYMRETISQLLMGQVVSRQLLKPKLVTGNPFAPREREVLALICEELTNREIADKLGLSSRTVEAYRKNMIAKVGVRNTVGLVLFAVRRGWVEE